MRILLTGSNGFLGSHLAAELTRRGHQVVGLGRRPGPSGEAAEYRRTDLTDPGSVAALRVAPVDLVIHNAALAAPWAPAARYLAANVGATSNMLDWARNHGAPRFLFVSSTAVLYQARDQFDLGPDDPIPAPEHQLSDYARTKAAAEELVAGYPGDWAILRPRAVFGPGDRVLLPRLLAAAQRGRLPRFTRPGGAPVRTELTPVETVVGYLARAAETEVRGRWQVSSGEPVELDQVLDRVLAVLGHPARTRRLSVRAAWPLAGALETWAKFVPPHSEPLITRFGVSMFAHSRTFDVSRTVTELGPPALGVAEALSRLEASWLGQAAPS
jgi:nucleoside-diphosphate-sugar epimerase